MKTRKTLVVLASAVLSLLMISTPTAFATIPTFGLDKDDFRRISVGGFGDSANSYAWGMEYFKGDLYVGTNRHHLWSVGQGLEAGLGLEIPIDIVEDPPLPIGSLEWANDMRGEIWRYRCGEWERVHQSEVIYCEGPIPPAGHYPVSYGYRMMGTFEDHIYVCGIGTWWPPMPFSRVLRSESGDSDSWEDVTGILAGTNNVRGLVEYKGSLYVSASIPGASPTGAGLGVVYRYTPECCSDVVSWTQVSELGFGSDYNAEIPYLTVFNCHLYASTVNYETGFEVWKTDGTVDHDEIYVWEQVVADGFGDTWNQWGMTMEAFNDHLYVGSAVGGGMVLRDTEIVGTRAIDVIRIDKDDNVELVVGAYIPRDPPPGWPTFRVPLSKWPAGFGNPLNVYVWHMEVHDGVLYLGTLDLCRIVQYIPELLELIPELLDSETLDGTLNNVISELTEAYDQFKSYLEQNGLAMDPELEQYIDGIIQELKECLASDFDVTELITLFVKFFSGAYTLFKQYLKDSGFEMCPELEQYIDGAIQDLEERLASGFDVTELITLFVEFFGGADLWKSYDGITWMPVTLNGFDNPNNYGIRRLLSVWDKSLYVGTANPFTGMPQGGCEVLEGREVTVVSCDEGGDAKFEFYPPEDVYVKGEGFPRCQDVTIYVIPNGLDPEPDNAVLPTGSPGKTDVCGRLPVTLVWSGPLDLGEYDVWVDVNQNGEYDRGDVYVYFGICIDLYLFLVIPENHIGSLGAVLAMFGSIAALRLKKNGWPSKRFR